MKKQINVFQTKEQDKCPETCLNGMEISGSPDGEFKIIVLKILMGRPGKQCVNKVRISKKR